MIILINELSKDIKKKHHKNKTEIEKLQKQMALQDEKAKKEKIPGPTGSPFRNNGETKKRKKNRLNPTLRSTQ